MRIREIDSDAELESLRPAWWKLSGEIEDDSPYLTPAFLIPWIRHSRRRYAGRVLAAWQENDLVGLAPLFDRSHGKQGMRFVIRTFPIHGTTPPLDMICTRQRRAEVLEAFVRHWAGTADWDLIELLNVPSESSTENLLREAARDYGWRVHSQESLKTFYVPVAASWDAFFNSLSRNIRHNVRRGLRRCREYGSARFLRYPSDGIVLGDALNMAIQVTGKSWKRDDGEKEGWSDFLRILAGELDSEGLLSMHFLLMDERPIGYLLEIDYRGNIHTFHSSYDLEFQKLDPGVLLIREGLRRAHERGCGRYDFTGRFDYLNRWTEATRTFRRIRVENGTFLSGIKNRIYFLVHERRSAHATERVEAMKNARKNSGVPAPPVPLSPREER